jgi:hypothetical protein
MYKYQHRPLQDLPKFTQIGIFGLKIYQLATLVLTWRTEVNVMITIVWLEIFCYKLHMHFFEISVVIIISAYIHI